MENTTTTAQVLEKAATHHLTDLRLVVGDEVLRYAADDLSAQPVRFFVTEFVREAAFAHLGAELPYALAVEVDEFRDGSSPLYIRMTLYTERESQTGMVVGRGGETIKRIGAHARRRIEAFLDTHVFLDLRVKTLSRWRSRAAAATLPGAAAREKNTLCR